MFTVFSKFELEYIEKAKEIDRELNMNLTLTAERHGYQQGEAHILMTLLKVKFNKIPEDYINKIKSADASTLERWSTNFVFAKSIEEVF